VRSRFLLVVALLVATAAPATAQSAPTLRGQVVRGDATCAPVAGAAVTVTGSAGATATTTGADGVFAAEGLAPDTYTVTAAPPARGFETATATVAVGTADAAVDLVAAPGRLPVERVAGQDRIGTGIAASVRAFPDGAPVVLLATAGAYPDALVAAPLAARLGGPLLLVGPRSGAAVLDEVARLGAGTAVVVGAVDGVAAVVEAELLARGLEVRRIAGESRFDTAALVAREVGVPADGEVAVATGRTFADALSFAAVAAARGIPILLTEPGALPADTADALAAIGARRTLVLGGTAAVGDAVAAALPAPTRVDGADRYATSVAIAQLARDRGAELGSLYVATGANWPDALAAGPLAATTGGPLLLLDGEGGGSGDSAAATRAMVADAFPEIHRLVALGGAAALPDAALEPAAQPRGPAGDCLPAAASRAAGAATGGAAREVAGVARG